MHETNEKGGAMDLRLDKLEQSLTGIRLGREPGYGRGVPFWAFYFSG